ncbi:hypothetical protein JCM17823_23220 [Halorubrum gandharaense]
MSDGNGNRDGDGNASDEENNPADEEFAAELAAARDLIDEDEGVDAVHVGVVRDGEVDTTFAQRSEDDGETEGLRALAMLAAHVRLVAEQAGVDPTTVAGDAATLAGQVDRIPASTEDLPDE